MPTNLASESNVFGPSLTALTDLGEFTVWSLIITVFGDLAQEPGDRISGPLLSAILDPIGIKPEARRVAMHRLRNDGWITSEKSGRTRLHRLTAFGRAQSLLANPKIYQIPKLEPDWHLLVTSSSAPDHPNHISVAPRVFLGNGPAIQDGENLIIEGRIENIPHWLRDQIETPDLVSGYAALYAALCSVQAQLSGKITTLHIAILRTLIVHHWRRLVLKHPALPDSFFSSCWRGADCRGLTFSLLNTLSRPQLSALENNSQ